MKNTLHKILSIYFILQTAVCIGQMQQYDFKRELNGINAQWHTITLPDEVFGKTKHNLNDIRIYGIKPNKDTIEAPYLLKVSKDKVTDNNVRFNLINTAQTRHGYYFIFEVPSLETINQINLFFKQQNFDWRVQLEGSQDLNQWFTIIKDYRILSIVNEVSNFQFTKLLFPHSKYRYFRLLVESEEKSELTTAEVLQHQTIAGTFNNYYISKWTVNENNSTKQSEIDIELAKPLPVSHIKIDVKDKFDYYRPIEIKYLSDSVKTEKGWKYEYRTLFSGTMHSLEKNEFVWSNVTTQQLKVYITNQNNQALNIHAVEVKGYVHELLARFTEPATYYLVYGHKSGSKPVYDINYFADKIPQNLTALTLGEELVIDKEKTLGTEPLFKNKLWLWCIMGLIVLVLGWFSLKMMKSE
jgi:hypothetical protein